MPARKPAPLAPSTYLNLLRVHDKLQAGFAELFRAAGLTSAQYNVLRIVRGAGKQGATCQGIGESLVTRVPDVTRLVDRMEGSGLVTRARSDEDRRVVRVRLTARGRKLCDGLDEPVLSRHRRDFAQLSRGQLEELNAGLERVLAGP